MMYVPPLGVQSLNGQQTTPIKRSKRPSRKLPPMVSEVEQLEKSDLFYSPRHHHVNPTYSATGRLRDPL